MVHGKRIITIVFKHITELDIPVISELFLKISIKQQSEDRFLISQL